MDHNNNTPQIVTRYAPSPTGFQHIGGIRTALFAYLWAKKNHGQFILRIEDTDKSREVEGAIQHTIDTLKWLEINYDYGPDAPHPEWGSARQSERLAIYTEWAQTLVDKGLAYPDPYSSEELQAFRDLAQQEQRPFLFRHHRPDTIGEWDGTQPLRFKVPEIKRYTWTDTVRGTLSAGEEMLDDFIIIKADGYPTYNFAHIIDDHLMGVTHVMRGEEFISSTPKFLSLYDTLQLPRPEFVTLPPIMGPDGKKKLSKRDGAKDILEYHADGYLPSALRNFLALIGWNPGTEQELFPGQELVEAFSIDKIQKSGGAFNEAKLKWMNHKYLLAARPKDGTRSEFRFDYVKSALPETILRKSQYSDDRLKRIIPTIFERIHNKIEVREAAEAGEYNWIFDKITYDTTLLQWKKDATTQAASPRLEHAKTLLETADFSSADSIKNALWDYAEEVGKGELLWPLRVALTGQERSPDPFTCAFVLGKTESLSRVDVAIQKLANQ